MQRLKALLTTVVVMTALVALVALVATGAPAQAKVAGTNGRILFSQYDPEIDDNVSFLANADGTGVERLLPDYASGSPHWSPDGASIAVVSGLGAECPPTCVAHTVIIDPNTADHRVITPHGIPDVTAGCSIWSPDATHFLCEGWNDSDPSVHGLYTVRSSDGGGLTRITAGEDIPIDYSPDGRRVVFGHQPYSRDCALYVVNTDGSNLHPITPIGFCDDDGSWSPDGQWIAFEHHGSIFVVHPDGTGLKRIPLRVESRSFAGDPVWSPDGQGLAFLLFRQVGARDFTGGIATSHADGTSVTVIIRRDSFVHHADWGAQPKV